MYACKHKLIWQTFACNICMLYTKICACNDADNIRRYQKILEVHSARVLTHQCCSLTHHLHGECGWTSPGGGEGAGAGCGAACLTLSAGAAETDRCSCESGRGRGGRVRDSGVWSPQNSTWHMPRNLLHTQFLEIPWVIPNTGTSQEYILLWLLYGHSKFTPIKGKRWIKGFLGLFAKNTLSKTRPEVENPRAPPFLSSWFLL